MGKYRPNIVRKSLNTQQTSPWTGKPIPNVNWATIVRNIHDAQERLAETDDAESATGLITADLFLVAIDEGLSPQQRVEEILDRIGKLAFYWRGAGHLPVDLMRRVEVTMTAAIEDLAAYAKSFEEFASDPHNLVGGTADGE